MSLKITQKRLPHHGKQLRRFVKWLEKVDPVKSHVRLHFHRERVLTRESLARLGLSNLPKSWWKDENELMGCYHSGEGLIVVATGGVDATTAMAIVAHEYFHAHQNQEGNPLKESSADCYAMSMVIRYQQG